MAEGRYPAVVETCAYLLVAEALDDAAGRAASHAAVSAIQDGGRLVVTVQDDGTDRTSAMVQLADRVGALDGSLDVEPETAASGAPVRVVVADDTLLTREGIVRLLGDAGIEVVAEADDAQGLLHQVRLTRPDVALVDIRMPPTHTDEGLVAAQTIRAEHPRSASWSCPSTSSPATPCACSRSSPNGSATCSRSASSTSPPSSTPCAGSWTGRR